MKWLRTHWTAALFVLLVIFFAISSEIVRDFERRYNNLQSQTYVDRTGLTIGALPNSLGYFVRPLKEVPSVLRQALLAKEDKYFFKHPGVNPVSILKRPTGGSSTLTQQLAKIVLGNESKRNVANKIVETIYAISLEAWRPKDEILRMYSNSVYLGNLAQGQGDLAEAVGLYQEALRHNPGFAEAHNNLGQAYEALGRAEEALAEYRQALALNPELAQAWYNLAVALERQGQNSEARTAYQRCHQLLVADPEYGQNEQYREFARRAQERAQGLEGN